MNENAPEMIYEPKKEGPEVKHFFELLELPWIDASSLEEIYTQLKQEGVEAAAKLISIKFGGNLQLLSNLPQPKQT